MTNTHISGSVSRFSDLKELYAEMTATPEFQAAFGDPLGMSIIEVGDQPEHWAGRTFAFRPIFVPGRNAPVAGTGRLVR